MRELPAVCPYCWDMKIEAIGEVTLYAEHLPHQTRPIAGSVFRCSRWHVFATFPFDSDRTLILCGAREQPAQLIHQAEFEEVVGGDNICQNVQAALQRAEDLFEQMQITTP